MKSKIYSTIAIAIILAFALIAAMPTTSVSAISHEGDKGGNMTQGQTGNMTEGGMTEGTMGENTGTMGGQ